MWAGSGSWFNCWLGLSPTQHTAMGVVLWDVSEASRCQFLKLLGRQVNHAHYRRPCQSFNCHCKGYSCLEREIFYLKVAFYLEDISCKWARVYSVVQPSVWTWAKPNHLIFSTPEVSQSCSNTHSLFKSVIKIFFRFEIKVRITHLHRYSQDRADLVKYVKYRALLSPPHLEME